MGAARLRTLRSEAEGKPSAKCANESYLLNPKPMRSNLGQDEVGVKPHGGPNVSVLKNGAMTCG